MTAEDRNPPGVYLFCTRKLFAHVIKRIFLDRKWRRIALGPIPGIPRSESRSGDNIPGTYQIYASIILYYALVSISFQRFIFFGQLFRWITVEF